MCPEFLKGEPFFLSRCQSSKLNKGAVSELKDGHGDVSTQPIYKVLLCNVKKLKSW